ncbi:hypothetical protein CI102_14145 [Trichoderma harzianum]|nr:hypothetical protein CI102_14145 [Trichoderma harzianum]
MASSLGDDPLNPPLPSELSQGAGLNEISTFFPSSDPQVYEFHDEGVTIQTRDDIEYPPPPLYTKRASQPPVYAPGASQQAEDIAEASQQAEEIIDAQYNAVPPSAIYDSFKDLFSFLQTFHRHNGTALRTKKSANPQVINSTKVQTYRTLVCNRTGTQASRSTRIRRSSTQQTGYLYKITATAKKSAN